MQHLLMISGWLAGLLSAADAPPPALAPFDAQQARAHQEAWSKHVAQPIGVTNSLGISLVLIPPGEFMMGGSTELLAETAAWADTKRQSPPGAERTRIENDEQPSHRVRLTKPFRLGATEVTIGQYRRFVEATRYVTETERFGGGNSGKVDETAREKKQAIWQTPGYRVTDDSPVTQLTWNDMVALCNWLSEHEKRTACYRLDDRKAISLSPAPTAIGFRPRPNGNAVAEPERPRSIGSATIASSC